jgi:hypothetical protein
MNDITLKIEGRKITVEKFKKAIDCFFDIITSVGRNVTQGDDSLEWLISVEPGSALIHARPQSRSGNPYFESKATEAIVKGVRTLESGEQRFPASFSEKTIEAVRDLAMIRDERAEYVSAITFSSNGSSSAVTAHSVSTVKDLIGVKRVEIGSITGQLLSITDRGGFYFAIWDSLTDDRVRCDVKEEMVDTVMGAFRKRVAVYGEIHYDLKERPRRITVEEIYVFKAEHELPSIDDVVGLFCEG